MRYEVLVIGGGAAGFCAAIQAARAGVSTLLVEKNGVCGGTMTMAGINFPGLFHAAGDQVIAGIGWELVTATLRESEEPLPDFSSREGVPHWKYQVPIDAVVFASLVDEALLKSGVEISYHTMLGALDFAGDHWCATLCGKDGLYEVEAGIVIDCTGDANATRIAGFEVRESRPCQPGTLSVYADGYDLDSLDLAAIGRAFDAAVAAGELSYEDLGWGKSFNPHFFYSHGNNCNHIVGINAADSRGRTRIEIAGRECILRLYRFFHRQPGLENLHFHFTAGECGVRESRTIVGEATITVEDYTSGRRFDDALCYSYYPIDLHDAGMGLDCRPLTRGKKPAVPRGALIPAGAPRFLAAGRIVSSDRLANSALRVQASCMATGQAAGAVAAVSSLRGCAPLTTDLDEVRRVLTESGAIVPV